jgi:hypothetical protein
MTIAEASQIAEKVIHEWLVNSSLKHFELWSGADCVELSQRLQVTYARFHNVHNTESTRHRYPFRRDENTDTWTLSPSTTLMRSAVSEFSEHVCTDGCWICLSMEGVEDVETFILYLDDIREEDWHHRIRKLTAWSIRDRDPSYKLWV